MFTQTPEHEQQIQGFTRVDGTTVLHFDKNCPRDMCNLLMCYLADSTCIRYGRNSARYFERPKVLPGDQRDHFPESLDPC